MTDPTYAFNAIKAIQPMGEFFIAKIPFGIITKCAKADIRRIETRDLERISGIQRLLNVKRVKKINEYVQTVDAAFPNSVVLNLDSNYLASEIREINENNTIENLYNFEIIVNEKTFRIIDGQHRIAGLKNTSLHQFDVIISFYLDLDVYEQAYMFSTINTKQIPVNKSLVMDLYALSDRRIPQKCANNVTRNLNRDENSPLYRRISLLGLTTRFDKEILYKHTLTQGTVTSKILEKISNNPDNDRDLIMRDLVIEDSLENDITGGLIFRSYFKNDEEWKITNVLKAYFNSVKEVFPNEWNDSSNPLSKTIGFSALMKFLNHAFRDGHNKKDLRTKHFVEIMKQVKINYDQDSENQLTFAVYPASAVGESKLYNNLLKWSKLDQ